MLIFFGVIQKNALHLHQQNQQMSNKLKNIVMKKSIILVALSFIATLNIFAQSEQPRNEISISYGVGVSMIGDGIGHGIGEGIFDSMTGRNWTNDKQFGSLGVEYFYHLNDPRMAIGAIVTYSQYGEDVEYKGVKEGERTRRYITVMPSLKYYYINNKNFGLYSKVAVGPMLLSSKTKDVQTGQSSTDSKLYFMFQASLLGVEGGSQNVRAFLEAGAGEQGIVLAGLRFKF